MKAVNLQKKFDELISIIKNNPYQTPPPYKKLVGKDYYSRRLNIQHRLVYDVNEEDRIIVILSVWSHYERGVVK